ncbi:FUSC family protein [Nocardioides zeae]|uniref:FUSC family protein n=1 Tax=Nocardioides imazamoxiresistens TaxID=3231893 RepID=A0ABU3PXI9_9ACTN|nr:FUSC family protein [Nocardioides zeae]MDT9593957.1 FUSC family protein [Nocardioides zeae]
MEGIPVDRIWSKSRLSLRARLARWRSKRFQIAQCAVAAGVAWFVAADVLGHEHPFFAPVAAVLCLGTSYAQRLRRVAEVAVGVAVGILIADLMVLQIGAGAWQLALVVVLAMSTAVIVDGGPLIVMQAGVQGIFVATLVPEPGTAFVRWTDALIGGAVALLAATLVPSAPLRRPREQAAVVARKVAGLLRAAAEVMVDGDSDRAFDVLADARATDYLIRELQDAADEGMSVVASSPFRSRHRPGLRQMSELVEPLDKALRSTRVLVRRTAVAAYHRREVPPAYSALCREIASAADLVAAELAQNRMAEAARPALLAAAAGSGRLERTTELSVETMLAQMRSVVADLLEVTGMEALAATDALPPVRD